MMQSRSQSLIQHAETHILYGWRVLLVMQRAVSLTSLVRLLLGGAPEIKTRILNEILQSAKL